MGADEARKQAQKSHADRQAELRRLGVGTKAVSPKALSNAVGDDGWISAIRYAERVEADAEADIADIRFVAEEVDDRGRSTSAAKIAKQRLKNPSLSSMTVRVTLHDRMPVTLNRLVDEREAAETALVDAAARVQRAHIASKWHEARRDLFVKASTSSEPRKRQLAENEITPEELSFIHAMREREVPPSAMDQGREEDRDFIAAYFFDLARPIAERHPAGVWGRTFSHGQLDMPTRAMSNDEAEAVRIVWSKTYDEARAVKANLDDAAGRELDITPGFALMLRRLADNHHLDEIPGLETNVRNAEAQGQREDVLSILKTLGLTEDDVKRATGLVKASEPIPGSIQKLQSLIRQHEGGSSTPPTRDSQPPVDDKSEALIDTTSTHLPEFQVLSSFNLPESLNQEEKLKILASAQKEMEIGDVHYEEWASEWRIVLGYSADPAKMPTETAIKTAIATYQRDISNEFYKMVTEFGVASAHQAYLRLEAARLAFEIATSPRWQSRRQELGIVVR